jgi:hypothetical protein
LNGAITGAPGEEKWDQFTLDLKFYLFPGRPTSFEVNVRGARSISYYEPQVLKRLDSIGVLKWIVPYGAPIDEANVATYAKRLHEVLADRFLRSLNPW